MNYYNEWDTKTGAWLRELIKAGIIPPGEVDERSITDVQPSDLRGFTQCHFFAGIGGWPYALHLAGWPADREVWTGSAPCQPFSCAGKQQGAADDRNLWPPFMRLIAERKPKFIFGEQVEAAIRSNWFDRVSADLEAQAYSVGAVVLGAHSVGAPHIRQRLYWVAHSNPRGRTAGIAETRGAAARCGEGGMGDADHQGSQGRLIRRHSEGERPVGEDGMGFWSDAIWHQCRDGKARRISPKPEIFPLASGLPGRVGVLRGAGNAICPQVAAEFVKATIQFCNL